MKESKIVKMIIDKALKNGYIDTDINSELTMTQYINNHFNKEHNFDLMSAWHILNFIISPDFLKAFFGEKKVKVKFGLKIKENGTNNLCFWERPLLKNEKGLKCWEYHLAKLLVEKEPVKYYEQFL